MKENLLRVELTYSVTINQTQDKSAMQSLKIAHKSKLLKSIFAYLRLIKKLLFYKGLHPFKGFLAFGRSTTDFQGAHGLEN